MANTYKRITVHVDVFKTDVVFIIGASKDNHRKEHKRILGDTEHFLEDDSFLGRTTTRKGHAVLVALKKKPNNPIAISSLAHECLHVATFICDSLGLPISYDNDEVLAYITQYLIKELLTAYRK